MLSKGIIKLINSLNIKKYRDKHLLFVAEGEKLVSDLIRMGAPVKTVISSRPIDMHHSNIEMIQCHETELNKISFLKHSPGIIALVKIIEHQFIIGDLSGKLSIGLDGIQDPGNMGTIIRLANWFGVEHIICSKDCVDIYNPKVVQATMGALMGVKVHYLDLPDVIDDLIKKSDYQIYGTYMEGESIYQSKLDHKGLLVMGNEGKGISQQISAKISKRIFIPHLNTDNRASESLNVGVATGIIVSEFVRQALK